MPVMLPHTITFRKKLPTKLQGVVCNDVAGEVKANA